LRNSISKETVLT